MIYDISSRIHYKQINKFWTLLDVAISVEWQIKYIPIEIVSQVSNYVALILELRVKNLTEGGKQACKRDEILF